MAIYTQAKPAGRPTWADVASKDAEATRAFYGSLFGWEFDVGPAEFGGYATARLGAHPAAGVGGSHPDAQPAWTLYFATDAIDADVVRATALGATVIYPAMPVGPFGSMAILADPTGAVFGLWQAGMHIGWQVDDQPGAVAWFELYTPDAKRARDFYSALMGASSDVMPGDMEYYFLKHGETMLAGVMATDPSWGNMPPMWGIYFSVADTDATAAAIVAAGGSLLSPIEDTPYGRMVAAADPAGAVFKVIQPPAA